MRALSLHPRRAERFKSVGSFEETQNTRYIAQRGFSLVEVSIVTALMILMAIIGLPAVQGYVIENKVPRVAQDLQRFVSRLKMTAIGAGARPYLRVDQKVLINGLRDATVVSVQGAASTRTVAHGLGGRGVANHGALILKPSGIGEMGDGSAFQLILNNVNHAACPVLAAVMQRMANQVSIAGTAADVIVKNDAVNPPMSYDPVLADAQCALGDVNHFTFVFH